MRNRQIVQLHQMARNGATRPEIAAELGVHPNTITDHLAFRVAYPKEVLSKIQCTAELPTAKIMRLYEASIFLPGWPSRAKTYALARAGVLPAKIERRGAWSGYVVTRAAIKKAARAMLPDGLWFKSDRIQHYAGSAVANTARTHRVQCRYWPSKEFGYVPASVVTKLAADFGEELRVPTAEKHRALETIKLCNVATIG